MTTKACTHCGQTGSLEGFHRQKAASDGRKSWCRACCAELQRRRWQRDSQRLKANAKAWNTANKDRVKLVSDAWDKRNPDKAEGAWLRRYWPGTTWKQASDNYRQLLAEQGGSCAICRQAPANTVRLQVDHDHRTGEVRGLLCGGCNAQLVPAVEHRDSLIDSARRYLKRP